MSFDSELLAALGTATDAWDIRAVVRRCWFVDFDGYPTRLWHGQGILHAGGYEWTGTIDATGQNRLQIPAVQDPRAGYSPRYRFGIPYLDADTWAALKAEQDLIRGRSLTCYRVIWMQTEDGLRPSTALKFAYRLTMRGAEFADSIDGPPGQEQKVYTASLICESSEVGRSRVPNGTYTDTAQRERARIAGVASDSGCSMVAANSRRSILVEGD